MTEHNGQQNTCRVSPWTHIGAQAIALSICIWLATGCGAVTRELEQTSAKAARTETQIKALLIDDASVDAASIQVKWADGSVVLSGFVGSLEESKTAERLARKAIPGKPVVNRLSIR